MTLTNLSEEEKIERKKQQKREAQKRWYEKNKDYYKKYNSEHKMSQVQKLKEQNLVLAEKVTRTGLENIKLRIDKSYLLDLLTIDTLAIIVFSMYMMVISVHKIFIEDKVVIGVFMLVCWTITTIIQIKTLFRINKDIKREEV